MQKIRKNGLTLLKPRKLHSSTIFRTFWALLTRRDFLFTNRPSSFFLLFDHKTPFKTSKFEWTLDNIRIEKIILVPNWSTKSFFGGCNLVNIEKIMMQPYENDKNTYFGPNLGVKKFCLRVSAGLVVRHFSKLSSYAI